MNLRSVLAAPMLSFGLFAALPADANNKLLNGEFAETGTATCLYTSGGFNSILEPNVPANSVATTESFDGVWTFNGAGSVSETATDIITSWVGASSSAVVPNIEATTTSGARKYVVDATDSVTVTITKGKWTIFAGPRPKQTFSVDKIVLAGHASNNSATVTLGTTTPAVETVTFSNGDVSQRICHRSIVLVKQIVLLRH